MNVIAVGQHMENNQGKSDTLNKCAQTQFPGNPRSPLFSRGNKSNLPRFQILWDDSEKLL